MGGFVILGLNNSLDKDFRNNQRYVLNRPLEVIIRSIGAECQYNLRALDISQSGLFLEFLNPGRFPFGASSILEIWLALPGELEPVFFNGKVARIVHKPINESEIVPGIGIRIVQMEKTHSKRLFHYLNNMNEVIVEPE